MQLWGAEGRQMRSILGAPPERTFYAWKAGHGRRVPEDVIRRIGYVAGIYKALQILYADSGQADGWGHRSNRFFGDQTPLERMAAGDMTDLAECAATSMPPALRATVVGIPLQTKHLQYHYDGTRVTEYFDYERAIWIGLPE